METKIIDVFLMRPEAAAARLSLVFAMEMHDVDELLMDLPLAASDDLISSVYGVIFIGCDGTILNVFSDFVTHMQIFFFFLQKATFHVSFSPQSIWITAKC